MKQNGDDQVLPFSTSILSRSSAPGFDQRLHHHMNNGDVQVGPPKTAAGVRCVHFPAHLAPVFADHLERFVGPEQDALLFPGEAGGIIRPHVLYKHWHRATEAIGRPELRFHDLRHSSATWAAIVGSTTRELMNRLGHASPAAALRYQHSTVERDRAIAQMLGQLHTPFQGGDVAQMSPNTTLGYTEQNAAKSRNRGMIRETDWSG